MSQTSRWKQRPPGSDWGDFGPDDQFGRKRVNIDYDFLMEIFKKDKVCVESGDMVCLHTGFADMLLEMNKVPDGHLLENSCAVLEGRDPKLLQWITDSGLIALIADNYAVEAHPASHKPGACATFLLTAPPLRLPGAIGSPATPIATV